MSANGIVIISHANLLAFSHARLPVWEMDASSDEQARPLVSGQWKIIIMRTQQNQRAKLLHV